eukprot:CAMPEP_0198141236 /NCGR_PEP_ID=MMETSP1443-20131203/4262_1 /TAXON_ID=186043 /ORGANISM="Entomoneis sp., Strain CCMP2396" /LENGTH=318 /DNA_ID=CAMNT_0043803907 /DNA_START=261 /DNA_END=1217 /DNA_ORIENTATION=+
MLVRTVFNSRAAVAAFQAGSKAAGRQAARSLSTLRITDDNISASEKLELLWSQQKRNNAVSAVAPSDNAAFESTVTGKFPGAISNKDLEQKVVGMLEGKGFTPKNTLLATSLCADELARVIEDDFVKIYGNNFNLGGLAGFPFAGNTGFGAMSAHIPDDGYCFIIYGPHVGVTADGVVGKVERNGIALVDTCCGSAIAASNYLSGITDGGAQITMNLQQFSDFQQGAVQELILPHGKRLSDAADRMVELPYALYDSQDVLVNDIVKAGAGGVKGGLVLLGGIQINTGPTTYDYFHPLRFDFINNKGELIENMLPELTK